MSENNKRINWEEIVNLYNTIKWLYALCEETDPELNTNLQPLNEFRAALDHIVRIIAIENLDEYKDKDAKLEAAKLRSHFIRALYDICDMISINYRNKIINILEEYTTEDIKNALPTYYSDIRPRIEAISGEIASLRTKKRFSQGSESEPAEVVYPKVIEELHGYYMMIDEAVPSLIELKEKRIKAENKKILTEKIIPVASVIVAIAGIVVGSLI